MYGDCIVCNANLTVTYKEGTASQRCKGGQAHSSYSQIFRVSSHLENDVGAPWDFKVREARQCFDAFARGLQLAPALALGLRHLVTICGP